MPGIMKVYVNVPPELLLYIPSPLGGFNAPLFHKAASLVVVCWEGPSFSHSTVVPALTVSVDGENEKSRIVMVGPALGLVLLLHAARARVASSRRDRTAAKTGAW
ncbi:MAG TPA: hypothetical protein VI297_00845 [Gemmatimonadales bacterium]